MTYRTDLIGSTTTKQGIPCQDASAGTINGGSIDRGSHDSLVLAVQAGSASGSPSSFTVDGKIQHSDTGTGGWEDVSGASVSTISSADSTETVGLLIDHEVKRHVRVVVDVAFTGGSSPSIPVAATVVMAGADRLT